MTLYRGSWRPSRNTLTPAIFRQPCYSRWQKLGAVIDRWMAAPADSLIGEEGKGFK
jgi:hypothetical protein